MTNYRVFPVKISRDRTNDIKMFPKTAKCLGTISVCPNCGRRGKLTFNFRYDSCNDEIPHKCLTAQLRNLNLGKFRVTHWNYVRKSGEKPTYLGTCYFDMSFFDVLNGLLVNGRSIPETITRELKVDVKGRGFDAEGRCLWSNKQPELMGVC